MVRRRGVTGDTTSMGRMCRSSIVDFVILHCPPTFATWQNEVYHRPGYGAREVQDNAEILNDLGKMRHRHVSVGSMSTWVPIGPQRALSTA